MVENDTSSVEYQLSTSTGPFSIPFYFIENGHIVAELYTQNGDDFNKTTLTIDVDYYLNGAGDKNGGQLTLLSAHSGATLLIYRDPDATQLTSYLATGKFPATSHERALDKLTMLIQKFGWWWDSLALKKPNIFSGYYDALGNRIRNLRDPSQEQDAATKNYVDVEVSAEAEARQSADNNLQSQISTNLQRTLRVPESSIGVIPATSARKNRILAFNNAGNPIAVIPESGSAADVMIEYAKPTGGGGIGLLYGGNVQHLQTFLSFDMLGIKKDGTDVTADIIAAFEKANSLGLPIVQNNGVYLISGDDVIPTMYGFDFTGARLVRASDHTGYFLLTQPDKPVTYDSSSDVVVKINSQTMSAGDACLAGLLDDTTLNGCCIFMEGADPAYISRGVLYNWSHDSRLTTRGSLETPLDYGVSAVTSLVALPVRPEVTVCRLPTLDFTNGPSNNGVFRIEDASRYEIHGGAVIGRPLVDLGKNPVVLAGNRSYGCRFYDFYDSHPSWATKTDGTPDYAYTLNFDRMVRCEFVNITSTGPGWGSVGFNSLTDCTFRGCATNRMDMHHPYHGYLKMSDYDSDWIGMMITGFGNIYAERVRLVVNEKPYAEFRENTGYFGGRPDFGWHAGKLFIKDLTIVGDCPDFFAANGSRPNLISMYSASAAYASIPAGSPIEPWSFKEIHIDGLYCETPIVGKRFGDIIAASSLAMVNYFPQKIAIKNADFNNSGAVESINMRYFKIPKANSGATSIAHTLLFRPTNYLELENVKIPGLEIIRPYSATNYHNLDAKFNKVKGTDTSNSVTPFYSDQLGRYTWTDCDIQSISDTTYSTASTMAQYSVYNIKAGVFNSLTGVPFSISYGTGYAVAVTVTGTMFVGPFSQTAVTAANANVANYALCNGCQFMSNTENSFVAPLLWSGSGNSVAPNILAAKGNEINISLSVTGASVTAAVLETVKVPSGAVTTGRLSKKGYSYEAAVDYQYQFYFNDRSRKAQIGAIVAPSAVSITALYLQ
ncbi:hypothetical protein WJE63_004445 [Klebsiella pneumoniae]